MPKQIDDRTVFQAVMLMVIERGYAGATTKEIADAAKISEVSLFRKYGTKGELVKTAIKATVAECDFENASRYTGEISKDLLRFLTCYQELANRCGQFFPTVFTEMPRYSELADIEDILTDVFGNLESLLKDYQTHGQLQDCQQ